MLAVHIWSRGVRRVLATVVAAVALGAAAPAGAAGFADREYADAVKTFRAGRTSEAYGQFVDLANRGDVDSARIALFLHQYGDPLFGKQWDVLPSDLAYWASLVRNSGTSARSTGNFAPTVLVPRKAHPRLEVARPAKPAPLKDVSTRAN